LPNASELIGRLAKADPENRLDEKIKALSKFQMLIIDEMGYLPFDSKEAHCFFQRVSRRYERSSIKITSPPLLDRIFPPLRIPGPSTCNRTDCINESHVL
jgi:DNA replication protein DnaC